MECLEEILARARHLIARCKTSYKTGYLLELNGWKALDQFETDSVLLRTGGWRWGWRRMDGIAVHGLLQTFKQHV